MSRTLGFVLIVAAFTGIPAFAQQDAQSPGAKGMLPLPSALLASGASTDASSNLPQDIRNNQYYLESLRLARLAEATYEYGDYDASTVYAMQAVHYARLSDEYVALQLKIKAANDAIAAAKQRIEWASSSGAAKKYPREYGEAEAFYSAGFDARSAEDWDTAFESASAALQALAFIDAPGGALPAQYTVRTWAESRDCLWNIAGRPWAYNDPRKWQMLYNANKSKMPQPDDPGLIHPGMVLDIPSAGGEERQGMWSADRTYTPVK